MSPRIRRDLALSLSAQLAYKALSFAVLAILARGLAPELAGAWLYALAVATIAGSLTDLGASDCTARAVAAAPGRLRQEAGRLLSARLPLLATMLLLVPGLGFLLAPDALPYLVLAAAYAALMECWRSLAALFSGLRRVGWTVIGFGGAQLLLVAGLGLAVLHAPGLPALAAAYLASALYAVLAGTGLLLRAGGRPAMIPAGDLLRRSWRLLALAILPLLHLKLGSLLLGPLGSFAAVAAYDLGARIVEASQLLVRPVTLVIVPACVALAAAGDRHEVRRLAAPALAIMAILGAGLAIAGLVAAPMIQAVLLGERYAGAVPLLRLLMLAVPGLLLSGTAGSIAVAMGLEARALLVAAAALALHLALAAALIAAHGAEGAALALVAAVTLSALGLTAVCAGALRGAGHRLAEAR